MEESIRTRIFRHAFNRWPCWRGSGAKVTFIASDWSETRVELPLSFRTRNYVGTIYGGSLYSSVDPFFMLMLMHILGPEYEVWDKGAAIRFRRPGRSRLYARMKIPQTDVEQIRSTLADSPRLDKVWSVDLVDADGTVHASIDKTIHVRKSTAKAGGYHRSGVSGFLGGLLDSIGTSRGEVTT